MNRTSLTLSLLLLFQIVVFGLVYAVCGGEDTAKVTRVVLLKDLDRDLVEEISISSDKDQRIVLSRGKDGWELPGHSDYPVDEKKLNRVLGKLLGLESSYVVSTSTEHHFELDVAPDKFRRLVVLKGPAGEEKLYIGGSGSGGFTNVRLGSEATVYAVDDLKVWEIGSRTTDWVKRELLDIDTERVARLEIKRAGADILLERRNLEDWRTGGKPAKKSEADAMVKKATEIQISDVIGRLSDPEVEKKLSAGKEHVTVSLGLTSEPLPEPAATSSERSGPGDSAEVDMPDSGEGENENVESTGEQANVEAVPVTGMNISESYELHLVRHPEKENVFYCYLKGGEHVVKVDRWRIKKLLEATHEKLLD